MSRSATTTGAKRRFVGSRRTKQLVAVRASDVSIPAGADELEHLRNPSPGEILLEDFLKPLGLSQTALARALRIPPRRINEIVLGKRAVTADTDLRLTRYFGLSPGFFVGLQADHDLMDRRRVISAELEMIAPRAA
jgi:antitoxin HigA-1